MRSTMGQSRISDLALLSIERDMVKDNDFDGVIDWQIYSSEDQEMKILIKV